MKQKALTKIWSTLALTSLLVSVNAVLTTQGSEVFAPGPELKDAERFSATIYGMIISTPIMFLCLWVNFVYIELFASTKSWYQSIPVAFNLEIEQESKYGKVYQRWMFGLFYLLPLVCQVHLIRKFFNGTVFHRSSGEKVIQTPVEHLISFQEFSITWGNEFRYGTLENGVTFFPGYQAWFFLLLELSLFLYFLYLVIKMKKKES